MITRRVAVEDYNPVWKEEFIIIKIELLTVLAGKISSIEHIGSTSVEGLHAKPIIDIDIVIDNNFEEVKALLESLGYLHEGDLGINGREAFRYISKPHLMAHHLYVCNKNSEELHRHIAFRDYLRDHKKERETYSEIKKELALKHLRDIDSYIKGKQQIIAEIYKKCGL